MTNARDWSTESTKPWTRSRSAKFRTLEQEILPAFAGSSPAGDDVHNISNLALLAGNDNSALSNSFFEVKRRKILAMDREGRYIPACTRNVFLKYYTDDNSQQLHFWGRQDRNAYFSAIVDAIAEYLKPEAAEHE